MKKQLLLPLIVVAYCTALAAQAPDGLSATGYRTTVHLQWNAYTAFEPAGFNLYRRTAGGNYGAPVRQIGTYSGYTDYDLAPATDYFYQIAAFDAAGIESPRSAEVSVATTFDHYLRIASLDLLVPIYTGGMTFDEPQKIINALELARPFFFRNTKGRLNLHFDFLVIPGYAPFNADGFADFATIETDLRNRGVLDNQYDAVHTVANQLYGFYGGAFMLGQSAGSMAHVGDPYPTLQTDVSGDTWVFIHEFGHALDLIISNYSGYPEMLFNHYNLNFPLSPDIPNFDAGTHLDGMALVLRLFEHHLDYAAPWDGYLEVVDADTDGMADFDGRVPVDEAGFGSSAFTNDSDLDGLGDLQEFYAGNFGGANPLQPDTDADGNPDGADVYPISNFAPTLAKAPAAVHVDGTLSPAEGWQPLASNPNFSKLPGASLSMLGTWDDQYLYFAFQSNHQLKYYLSLDASGRDGIWTTPVKWPAGNYAGLYENSFGDNYYETSALIIRADATAVYLKNNLVSSSAVNTVLANGLYTTEVRVPHNLGPGSGWNYAAPNAPTIAALSFSAGDAIGLDLLARPLAGSDGYEFFDYRDAQWLTLNEYLHFYDVVLTSGGSAPLNYCTSKSDFPWHDWIAGIRIGDIDHASGKSPYSDFTPLSTDLTTGQMPIEMTAGFSYTTWNEYWRVWIDLDHDGDFTGAGEMVFQGIQAPPPDGTPTATLAGNLNIPASALPGPTRMRVAMKREAFADPCETLPFGEVEDYTVSISPGPAQQPNLTFANYEVIPGTMCYTAPGQPFTYFAGLLLNNGTAPSGSTAVKAWFSKDSQLDAGDVPWQSFSYVGVPLNDVVSWNFTDPVPAALAPGLYYVLIQADPDATVAEANELDNLLAVQVWIGAPDLTVSSVGGAPAAIAAGSNMPLTVDVTNLAAFALNELVGSMPVVVYLSADNVLNPLDDATIGIGQLTFDQFTNPPLFVGGISTVTVSAAIPTVQLPGSYFVFAQLSGGCEQSTGNNVSAGLPLQITPVTTTYCPAASAFPWHDWIAGVQLGSFHHLSGKSPYSDFTGQVIEVHPDQSYPITLTAAFSYFTWDEYWRVWIDFNHDGVFSTPDELVQQRVLTAPAAGTPTASVTGSAAIPVWAPAGITRMRVAMKRGGFPSACEQLAFGEIEDYTVNITAAPPAPACGFSQTYPVGNGYQGFFAEQLGSEFRVVGAKPQLPTGTSFLSIITDAQGDLTGSSQQGVSAPMSMAPFPLRDGNYLFVSTTIDQKIKLVKSPGGGTPLWGGIYALPNSEGFNTTNVMENADGDLFVTGTIDVSPSGAFYKLFVLKVNDLGVEQWLTTYDVQSTPGNFAVKALDVTQDGGLIVYVMPGNVENHLFRISGNGSLLWNTLVTTTPLSPIRDAAETSDGSTIVAYTSDAITGPSPANVHFAHLTSDGQLLWVRTQTDLFGAVPNPLYVDYAQPTVLPTSSGRFTVAFTGPGGLYLAALSPGGTTLWTRVHVLTPSIGFFGRATDGGYLLAGSLDNQLWLMKTDHVGAICDSLVPPTNDYCAAESSYPWHDWIARVQLHSLDHASGKSAYSDFTDQTTMLQKDASYPVTLTTGYSWETFDEYWRVWIDFNHDGVFATPDELVQQQLATAPANGTPTTSVTGSIHIPVSALSGPTRMRVAMKGDGFPAACGTFAEGEVEDYEIVIGTAALPSGRVSATELPPDFMLWPNPAADAVQIRLTRPTGGPAMVRLLDVPGTVIRTVQLDDSTALDVELSLAEVPAGIYYVHLAVPGYPGAVKTLVVIER